MIDAARSEQTSLLDAAIAPPRGPEAIRALEQEVIPYPALDQVVFAGETVSATRQNPLYAGLPGKNGGWLARRRVELRNAGIELLVRWRAVEPRKPGKTRTPQLAGIRWLALDTGPAVEAKVMDAEREPSVLYLTSSRR